MHPDQIGFLTRKLINILGLSQPISIQVLQFMLTVDSGPPVGCLPHPVKHDVRSLYLFHISTTFHSSLYSGCQASFIAGTSTSFGLSHLGEGMG